MSAGFAIWWRRAGTSLAALLWLAMPAQAESWNDRNPPALDQWLREDLTPYLQEELVRHPRFKGEPVQIVSMAGDTVRSHPDGLSRQIIVALRDALLDVDGVNLVWPDADAPLPCRGGARANYYIGLEITRLPQAAFRVSVRALDLEDRSWVGGFGKTWLGRLSRGERNAYDLRQRHEELLGSRDRPFDETQVDLLAQRLAERLAERFCGHVGAPLRIAPAGGGDAPPIVTKTISLVSNYLAESREIQVVGDAADANTLLTGKLVTIDDDLHQFWIQLRAAAPDRELADHDLQAYVRVTPARTARHAPATRRTATETRRTPPRLLSSLRVMTPADPRRCRSADPWRRGARVLDDVDRVPGGSCFALEVDARRAAHVFLLRHDPNEAPVRLLPSSCDRYGQVRTYLRRGATLRFPSQHDGRRHVFFAADHDAAATYYAVAVTDDAAADELVAQLMRTADFCRHKTRKAGAAPADWLASLQQLSADLGGEADWRRLRIRTVRDRGRGALGADPTDVVAVRGDDYR